MEDKTSIEKHYTIDTGILPAISASFTRATTLELPGLDGKGRIRVHSSGKVELIDCSDVDEAARIFWNSVERMGLKLTAPEAAPVQLPEPDGFLESHPLGFIYHRGKPSQMQTFCGACPPMYEAGTVRALLAGVSAPAAQTVPEGWRLVPVEPTKMMVQDARKIDARMAGKRERLSTDEVWAIIAAALASAPVPPAAAPQAQADAREARWLQPDDMAALERFAETTDDDQSYDIGKDSVQRLSSFGCLKNCGFGRYEITSFGSYLLNDWERARVLPFTTQADRDATHRAAIAAAKEK